MRKGRQRSGGRMSMHRFFSWFRGKSAMLQSSTRSVGVTMFRVCVKKHRHTGKRLLERTLSQVWISADSRFLKLTTRWFSRLSFPFPYLQSYIFISLLGFWPQTMLTRHKGHCGSVGLRAGLDIWTLGSKSWVDFGLEPGTFRWNVSMRSATVNSCQASTLNAPCLVWLRLHGTVGLPGVCFQMWEMALLNQWFSTRSLCPAGTLAMSTHNFGCHRWRGRGLLASSGYSPGMLIPVQWLTEQRFIQPQMSVLRRLRNPVLPWVFKIWLRDIS